MHFLSSSCDILFCSWESLISRFIGARSVEFLNNFRCLFIYRAAQPQQLKRKESEGGEGKGKGGKCGRRGRRTKHLQKSVQSKRRQKQNEHCVGLRGGSQQQKRGRCGGGSGRHLHFKRGLGQQKFRCSLCLSLCCAANSNWIFELLRSLSLSSSSLSGYANFILFVVFIFAWLKSHIEEFNFWRFFFLISYICCILLLLLPFASCRVFSFCFFFLSTSADKTRFDFELFLSRLLLLYLLFFGVIKSQNRHLILVCWQKLF